ncbi:hypothetical protein C1H46_023115 [Malus baccata]|uniref:Uncharacterized protein n=1 Tax=Malus baccata TaxID=106549 RepID=A0A540LXR6_MALBA|nr:hypothetical protein C1H46_023115 [Malus baccata]
MCQSLKTPAKEVAPSSSAHRTRSAQASAFSDTSKPHDFADITKASEEERSVGETDSNEVAGEGLADEETNNTDAESDLGSGGHP